MNKKDLLLEVGMEEIPAGMVELGAQSLASKLCALFEREGLSYESVSTFYTPRRIAVLVMNVDVQQQDKVEIITGPLITVAFDADGNPTKAGLGFAKAHGKDISELLKVRGQKGEVIGVEKRIKGRQTVSILSESIPDILSKIEFPKKMRWGDNLGPFVRPIHWICCLFGNEVVEFEFAGIRSGRKTRGHRFMAPKEIDIKEPQSYETALKSLCVVPRFDERQQSIISEMHSYEQANDVVFIKNDALLNEVSNLVEMPILVVGRFDKSFLSLPKEVLIEAMAAHQRYFAIEDRMHNLVNAFGVVSNTKARDMSTVVKGYERVLAARLYDARFFYEQDIKAGIVEMSHRLSERVFLKGAGTMADKRSRLVEMIGKLCKLLGLSEEIEAHARRAAFLCKADLMSGMVGEFPSLQGIMGMYYALEANEPNEVAVAIKEHYLPRFAGDVTPSSICGAILGVADRLDTLFTCFRLGVIGSGSQDPLGLRRQASGLLKILIEQAWQGVNMDSLFSIGDIGSDIKRCLLDFIRERFFGILASEYQVPSDIANAILENRDALEKDEPYCLVKRACILRDFAYQTEGFRDFLENVYKRVSNILRKADTDFPEWRQQIASKGLTLKERDYSEDLPTDIDRSVEFQRLASMKVSRSDLKEVLVSMYAFKEPLARFFGSGRDGVPVLVASDPEIRIKRLALLYRIIEGFSWFADFSKISTR